MSRIKTIFLSSNFDDTHKDRRYTNTDVIVIMDSGEKYVSAFFNYHHIDHIRKENQRTGEFLRGKYFWARDLILIDDCNLENIRIVVDNLIGEGDFTTAFRLLI